VPGTPCAKLGGCGDGLLQNDEQCDDKNTVDHDGCTSCKVDSGWICPIPSTACVAKECGDGLLAGDEECDDKNLDDTDGCSKACKIQDGFKCPTPGQTCEKTTCGDGKVEGTEQCDDQNPTPFDGCSPSCTKEPSCPKTGGECTGACGDGIVFPGEECDDGNTKDNDGCSHLCKKEQGFECTLAPESLPDQIDSPIIYRDFSRGDTDGVCSPNGCPNGHPDMDTYSGTAKGIPGLLFDNGDPTKTGVLDNEGKPQYKCTLGSAKLCTVTSADTFKQWYRDLPGADQASRVNYTILRTLPLTKQTDGSYQFDSNGSTFFPIDDVLPPNSFGHQYKAGVDKGGDHNFHFTSELRFWFQYDQKAIDTPPSFDFTGDDDVFVFINGKFAVDIGGVHEAQNGSVTLDATNAGLLGLEKDKVYEFALFQAERNRSQSNYKATFRGFARAKSVCTPTCGDGFKTPNEVCDDGQNNDPTNTPGYGKCAHDCKSRGPYCGDGTLNDPPETCDDGLFNGGYNHCNATCDGPGPRCGDGKIDTPFGELCDDGDANDKGDAGATAYGKCASDCRSRPRCGDGLVNGPEQCDGAPVDGKSCKPDCTLDTGGVH
jgi:fibro-slime domain-containing protein